MASAVFDQDIQFIKGIGPKRAAVLNQLGIFNLLDLLEYYPRRYIDRTEIKTISQAKIEEITTFIGEVKSIKVIPGRRKRLVVTIGDGTGLLQGIWFNNAPFFKKFFEEGQLVSFSGKISFYGGWQIVHPDFDILGDELEPEKFINTGTIIPIYPSSEELKKMNLTSFRFRQIIRSLLEQYTNIPEILPQNYSSQLPVSFGEAIKEIHFPTDRERLKHAIYCLKYTELFVVQILVALRSKMLQSNNHGISFELRSDNIREFLSHLPFELTSAQKKVLKEISFDLNSDIPMHRLLQGDVGSGKTIVAFIAMLLSVENGFQTALMVPTEILAEQHYLNACRFFQDLKIVPVLLKGGLKKKERDLIYEQIEAGEKMVIIGTHALLQEGVQFNNLGLIIIDEQHRFGVLQRKELVEKSKQPHVLVMTATPIPRTLTMTVYGDLHVSIIDELPKGRLPIKTAVRNHSKMEGIYKFIEEQVNDGRQVYVVYPLIEESEKLDFQAAKQGFEEFREKYELLNVGLLHGRMKVDDKDHIMDEFKQGNINILISTTVIEVGVDVPNATIMLIMNAERFGLSQLHQLRGRVGRGNHQSYCILLQGKKTTEDADLRLAAMENTNDGFEIAEMDWQIRGAGEFFGVRQSGFDDLKIANLLKDQHIVEEVKARAFELVDTDPHLLDESVSMLRKIFLQKYKDKLDNINLH